MWILPISEWFRASLKKVSKLGTGTSPLPSEETPYRRVRQRLSPINSRLSSCRRVPVRTAYEKWEWHKPLAVGPTARNRDSIRTSRKRVIVLF